MTCHRPRRQFFSSFQLDRTCAGGPGQPQLGDRAEKTKPKQRASKKRGKKLFRLFSSSRRHAARLARQRGVQNSLLPRRVVEYEYCGCPAAPATAPHLISLPPFLRQSPFSPMAYKSRRRRPPCPHHRHHHHNLACGDGGGAVEFGHDERGEAEARRAGADAGVAEAAGGYGGSRGAGARSRRPRGHALPARRRRD